jgi:carbon monoxide dehydrogenase subunit G
MLTLLKWLFYLVVTVAVIIAAGSFILPSQVVVTRSIEIAAPPEKVFAIVGDLHRFQDYSPWAALDPGTTYTFEGPASGVGQKMSWTSGKADVGSGSQTVTEYEPPKHVGLDLDFGQMGKPTAAWDLEPSGAGTRATWTFRARLDGVAARWFGLMFDRWIGADYEKGLARLKSVAEKPDAGAATPGTETPPATQPAPDAQTAPGTQAAPGTEATTPN